MKKKVLSMVCLAMLFMLLPITAYADVGPKPSIIIDFKGLEKENYYVTLLSKNPSTGPYTALSKNPNQQKYTPSDDEYEIWKKFVSYEDVDEYYFLQFFSNCSKTSQFVWGYYPPSSFKILLYFPETDSFMVSSEIYERYAFDSYYTACITAGEIQGSTYNYNGTIKVEKSYDYTWEIISLLARIIATVAIEIAIALLFGFRAKKQIFIILTANIITQSVLNILLAIINYSQGSMMFVFSYVLLEFLVFAIEAAIYYIYLNKYSNKKITQKWIAPLYALLANIASFGIGLFIARIIPGIF
ncbi:hypothetical protein [Desulforamulus aeronauticus]|uniref:Uncharacterized protein n=1 Tax=Desulforamulus aeronauticus DSM 10349 TaxID=1121421 RepID=A0A1M6Q155_9FIRM|nr:hypothetical protein [Desulforamulus aeronauticus]SHK13847.1 hypothetical protein SAMN02745123_00840 [Desulforamulus aeronauticus DSM 10349]